MFGLTHRGTLRWKEWVPLVTQQVLILLCIFNFVISIVVILFTLLLIIFILNQFNCIFCRTFYCFNLVPVH